MLGKCLIPLRISDLDALGGKSRPLRQIQLLMLKSSKLQHSITSKIKTLSLSTAMHWGFFVSNGGA